MILFIFKYKQMRFYKRIKQVINFVKCCNFVKTMLKKMVYLNKLKIKAYYVNTVNKNNR